MISQGDVDDVIQKCIRIGREFIGVQREVNNKRLFLKRRGTCADSAAVGGRYFPVHLFPVPWFRRQIEQSDSGADNDSTGGFGADVRCPKPL